MRTLVVLTFVALLAAGLEAQTTAAPESDAARSYQPKSPADKARSDAEFNAIAYLHTLANAEKVYFRKHGQYPATLAGLVGTVSFTRRMASPNRGDYTVSYRLKGNGYAVTMSPKQFDEGHRAFYMDESGQIRVEDTKRASADSSPLK